MARKSLIEKNKNRKALVEKYKSKRLELKSKIMDKSVTVADRYFASIELSKLPRYSSKTSLTNRCMLTGRARGVYRKRFNGLSRIALRELALDGMLNGVLKR